MLTVRIKDHAANLDAYFDVLKGHNGRREHSTTGDAPAHNKSDPPAGDAEGPLGKTDSLRLHSIRDVPTPPPR